jgi:hypothetical protein
MRRCLGFCLMALLLLFARPLHAQEGAGNPNTERAKAYAAAREIPYDSVPDFLKLPPGIPMGEAVGVARNSKNEVFVFNRNGDYSRLFKFDANGKFVREIGKNLFGFAFAHAVRVDKDDNIWTVDEGTNMVIKFSPEGRVLLVMGRRSESHGLVASPAPGTPPPMAPYPLYTFGRPTDIAFDTQGNFFVSDGYEFSRVVKYDKNGTFIKSIGTRGSGPSQFNTPHGIATDADGNVYVADRGNRRIQVFSNDLVLRAVYDNVGAPWAICITPGPHQYLYSSNSNPDNNDSRVAAVSGEVYKMELDGTVVGRFGKAGKLLKEFTTIHAMDCKADNDLLVGEIDGWRVQHLILHAPTQTSSAR